MYVRDCHVSIVLNQVVMGVARLYHHLAPKNEVGIIAKPLIRLLKSHRSGGHREGGHRVGDTHQGGHREGDTGQGDVGRGMRRGRGWRQGFPTQQPN